MLGWLTDEEDAELLALDDRWVARRRAADALRSLGRIVARGNVDTRTLEAIDDVLRQQLADVSDVPDLGQRLDYMEAKGLAGPRNRLALELSAVAGRSNASSLPMVLSHDADGRLTGTIVPDTMHEGPPNFMHGGLIVALFDEFLGLAQTELLGPPAVTGTLSVRYLKPTPLDVPLQFRLGGFHRERRKRVASAGLWSGVEQTAACEAIFIESVGDAE